MVVRLRLARHGTRNNPFYHLVAIHNKKRRNALPIEKLGEYDPIPRWRPPPPPSATASNAAAGPSRAVQARAEGKGAGGGASSASASSSLKPEGSAALADVPPPRSMSQVDEVLLRERERGALTSTSSAAESSSKARQVADDDAPREGYGLLMTSGLQTHLRLEKRIEWNEERIRYWLGVGAQPSKPVAKLLDKAGLIPKGKWFKGMRPIPGVHDVPPPHKRKPESEATRTPPASTSESAT